MYKLYIFDVDGTLVRTKSGAKFRKSADDWIWLPGRIEKLEKLAALREQGVIEGQFRRDYPQLATATIQGGVAYGYHDEDDMQTQLSIMCNQAKIDHLFVCYNHPTASLEQYRVDDFDRKPKPGMLFRAMLAARVTVMETVFIGDREEDEQAARNAGIAFVHADQFFS